MVIDGSPFIHLGINRALEETSGMTVCAEARGIADALPLAENSKPDVIVLELRLRDGKALDVVRWAKLHLPEARFVIFSALSAGEVLNESIGGVSVYVLKESPVSELIQGIEAAAESRDYLDGAITKVAVDRLRRNHIPGPNNNGYARMSNREKEVFGLLRQALSNREIAKELQLSERTVESNVSSILRKLGVSNRTQAAIAGNSQTDMPPENRDNQTNP